MKEQSGEESQDDYVPFSQSGLACKPVPPYDYRVGWMKQGLVIPIAGEKRSAWFGATNKQRRPQWPK